MLKRIIMSMLGVLICAVSVGFFKIAAFGVDPFQSFMSGIHQLIPISFGTLYVIVNVVLLSFSLMFDRHYIGLATFINLFLLGYVTDFSYHFLQQLLGSPTLPVRLICLGIGIVVCCFSLSLYITADLGVSTYDAVALILVNKWHIGKFKLIRIMTDLICVCLGAILFLLGGGAVKDMPAMIGLGTIITACFMGPLVEFFNVTFSRPLLHHGNPTPTKT